MFVSTGIYNHSASLRFEWVQGITNPFGSSFLAYFYSHGDNALNGVVDVNGVLVEGYVLTDHDEALKWKHFPHHWPFVRESTDHRLSMYSFYTGPVIPAGNTDLWRFFMLARANFWTNKHSMGRWSETSWRSCDITVMPVSGYKPELIHSEAQSTLQQRTASLKSPAGSSAIKCIVSRSRQLTYLFHHNTIKTHWRFPDTDRGLI